MKIVNPVAKEGEDLASKFLQNKGYKILERNFRKGYGELDIIAIEQRTKTLVFIEVKTRTNSDFGSPFEAITPWKLKSIIKTAQFYKLTHKNLPESLRIDAISVELKFNNHKIEHLQNITGF